MISFYLPIIILSIVTISNEKLVFVETIFRHGARGPNRLNDTKQDLLGVVWPAPAELTAIGKRMEYLLGLYNRRRYITGENPFLSKKFDPHEILVFSTNVNRTLLSVTSQLQGLYPASPEIGDILTPEQFNVSFPPINITYEDYAKEIESLNDSALPHYMTVVPVHYLSLRNVSINCTVKMREIFLNNSKKDHILSFVDEFNKNYSLILNNYYNRENKTFKYEYGSINSICDDLIADLTEGKNISQFFIDTGMDENYYISKRFDILSTNYKDCYFGDENNIVILTFTSPILSPMINFMKRKIEDDINGNPSVKNASDYSRPKMVLVSGHDTYLSGLQMFFIRFFDLGIDKYIYPVYTSQMTFEVTRDDVDDNKLKNLKYSDYRVIYYFNDKLIMNITFDKFSEKIESVVWNDDKLYEFCVGNAGDIKDKKKENLESNLVIIIFMGIIIIILVITIIFVIVKLRTKKDDILGNSFKDNNNNLVSDNKEE